MHHFTVGLVSGLLNLPGSEFSPVRLTSGVAFAALLVFGTRLWPGVWLGDLALGALWILAAPPDASVAHLASVIAVMATITSIGAVVGVMLTRRSIPDLDLLETPQALAGLVLAAAGACLLTAGLGTGALWALGLRTSSNVGLTFGAWWVRDLAAILIVSPLALAWHLQWLGSTRRWARVLAAPVGLSLLLVVVAYLYLLDRGAEKMRREFEQRARSSVQSIVKDFEAAEAAAGSVAALYAASDSVEREEFEIFTRQLLGRLPALSALEWAPRVPLQERVDFERRARSEGLAGFSIRGGGADASLGSAGNHDEHFPVFYVVPLAGNEPALGFDLASSSERRATLFNARDTGRPAATGRFRLVEEEGDSYGFLLAHPIYDTPLPPSTLGERRNRLVGYVLAVIRLSDIMAHALAGLDADDIEYDLIDLDAPDDTALLHSSRSAATDTGALSWSHDFELGQRRWRVRFSGSAARSDLGFWVPWAMMEAGALLTGLLALLLISILGRTARIERLVQERTAELEAVSEKLRHLTVIDPLTQLLNRRGIEEKLARLTRRPETDVVAVLIDLDDFKCVNDSYGHSMGDAVLSGTAEAIVQSVRPTDLVARIGGDEFLAILPNSPLSAAASVAERIRTAVEKLSFEGIPRGEAPTVSLGAGAVPPATENVTELLKELGASLHKSTRAGKNRLSFV
jgi:diguanylate cyclase (GGDEF)-like protein